MRAFDKWVFCNIVVCTSAANIAKYPFFRKGYFAIEKWKKGIMQYSTPEKGYFAIFLFKKSVNLVLKLPTNTVFNKAWFSNWTVGSSSFLTDFFVVRNLIKFSLIFYLSFAPKTVFSIFCKIIYLFWACLHKVCNKYDCNLGILKDWLL